MAALEPEKVLRELDGLWVSLGGAAQSPEQAGVLRACSMTFLVLAEETSGEDGVGETLAELMPRHPSRCVVVRIRPGSGAGLDSRVVAQCWMPFGQRQQICCERIEITASRDTLADLPPLLLALAAPDLPVVVWCRSLSILHDGAFPALVSAAHKLIVDSASFPDPCSALEWLAGVSRRCLALADLEWTRLTPWRETIARLFDEPGRWLRLRGIRDLCICCKGPRTTVSAYYLAAWLRDAIGADMAPLCKFQVSGEEAMPELEGVHLAGPDWDAALQLAEDRSLEVRADSQAARLCLPAISDCSLLSEELKISGSDPIYERSLALARGIAAGQGDLP